MNAPPQPTSRRAASERWRVDAGTADVATLDIPADSQRTRWFEIDCRFVVAHGAAQAQHGMRVEVDGALEWVRRAATENPGDTDSMDYHFRRAVAVGKSLHIVVKTEVLRATRVGLTIEAEEG